MRIPLFFLFSVFFLTACSQSKTRLDETNQFKIENDSVFNHLSVFQKQVMCGGATEKPFTGKYLHNKAKGIYQCAACGNPLFSSSTKYDSGSGWPSFYNQLNKLAITEKPDTTYGMQRIEILCAKCGGHLGHIFNDGPEPTGLRYCVNSASLLFVPKE